MAYFEGENKMRKIIMINRVSIDGNAERDKKFIAFQMIVRGFAFV